MKTKTACTAALIVGLSIIHLPRAFSQGSLTPPPGPPAATMKSLDQIEPRIPISSLPFTISQEGSYYLTKNLDTAGNGISVGSSNVTVDLNGFTIEGTGGSGAGIDATARDRVVVKNGMVRGFPLLGIKLGNYGVVERVVSSFNGQAGINIEARGSVTHCTSVSNGGIGISVGNGSSVLDSITEDNTGIGISCENSLVARCLSRTNGGAGIAANASQVADSMSSLNTGAGITATDDCHIERNTVTKNGNSGDAAGILVTGTRTLVQKNQVSGNDRGLEITGTANVVRENTVLGNTSDNYDFAAGNVIEILLSQLPETIEVPANVRLAGTLSGGAGITVSANDVTIDLGGHSLLGPGAASGANSAVLLSGIRQSVTIHNGAIRNWGSHGIDGTDDDRITVRRLESSSNGGAGIYLRSVARVEGCSAFNNTAQGIRTVDSGRVIDCVVDSNDGDGIVTGAGSQVSGSTSRLSGGDGIKTASNSSVLSCTVTDAGGSGAGTGNHGIETGFVNTVADCTVQSSTGDGINVNGGSSVNRCTTASNSGDGIQLADEAIATDCVANGNTGDGIVGSNRTVVRNCQAANNGASGIWVSGARNKVESNNVVQNLRGIQTSVGGNLIVRNTASGNPAATSVSNYVIGGTNEVGPIGGVASGTNSTANLSY